MFSFTGNGTVRIELPAEVFADALRDAIVRAASVSPAGGAQILPAEENDCEIPFAGAQSLCAICNEAECGCPSIVDGLVQQSVETALADGSSADDIPAKNIAVGPCVSPGCGDAGCTGATAACAGCGDVALFLKMAKAEAEAALGMSPDPVVVASAEIPDVVAKSKPVLAFDRSGVLAQRMGAVTTEWGQVMPLGRMGQGELDEGALVAPHFERARLAQEYLDLQTALNEGMETPETGKRMAEIAGECGVFQAHACGVAAAKMRELAETEELGLQVAVKVRGGFPWTESPKEYGTHPLHAEDGAAE